MKNHHSFQGHGANGRIESLKNSSDSIGNGTATFGLVAQCLNQLRHRVPSLTDLPSLPIMQFISARELVPHLAVIDNTDSIRVSCCLILRERVVFLSCLDVGNVMWV
jgi:hypothetical protein